MKEYVCDRIEGDFALLVDENGKVISLPLSSFPIPPKEGDVLGEDLIFDEKKTQKKKETIQSRFDRLKKKG